MEERAMEYINAHSIKRTHTNTTKGIGLFTYIYGGARFLCARPACSSAIVDTESTTGTFSSLSRALFFPRSLFVLMERRGAADRNPLAAINQRHNNRKKRRPAPRVCVLCIHADHCRFTPLFLLLYMRTRTHTHTQ